MFLGKDRSSQPLMSASGFFSHNNALPSHLLLTSVATMEDSYLLPEQIMLPSSPSESVDSVESASEMSRESEEITAKGPEDVIITLSLPPPASDSPRNRSPIFKAHVRSHSLAESSPAPPMMRAHSSPGLDSRGRYVLVNGRGLSSPLTSNDNHSRQGSAHTLLDDRFEGRLGSLHISESISENAEFDPSALSSNPHSEPAPSSPILVPQPFPRIGRRRPSSPLQGQASSNGGSPSSSFGGQAPTHSSPSILSSKYNESYPSYSASSASSMPSTPTSLRSRSPSISSLETIPDIPDAEAEAIEADRIAALKAAAESVEASDDTNNMIRRRGTSEALSPCSSTTTRTGLGGYGHRTDKRKRWSVCGAERRQDLDLETIWED